MKIIVTGSEGFLGQYIVRKLYSEDCHAVVRLDTRNSPYPIDITEYNQFAPIHKLGVDVIIHLAAIAAPRLCDKDPQLAYKVNVHGTGNILRLAKETGAKVIFASSAHVYGISPRYMPSNEGHGVGFNTDTYTQTKILGEYLCKQYWDNYNVPYVSIRLFNSYGPGQSPDYFIPAKIIEARDKKSIFLKGSEVVKDFVYVEDVAEAYYKAAISDFVGEINIGSGIKTKLKDVAEVISAYFGAELHVSPKNEDNSPTEMCADIERARKVLKWEPKTVLTEGLAKTCESYRNL